MYVYYANEKKGNQNTQKKKKGCGGGARYLKHGSFFGGGACDSPIYGRTRKPGERAGGAGKLTE